MDLTTVGLSFAAYPPAPEPFGMSGSDVVWLLAFIVLFCIAYDYYRTVMKQREEIAAGRKAMDNLIKEREELYKGRIMTRKQREKYKRRAIPDAILDGLERAWEKGLLTRSEVNEAFRVMAHHYKYADLKTRKRWGLEEECGVVTGSNIPSKSYLERIKAAINLRLSPKFKALIYTKPKIPGPMPVQNIEPKKEKGVPFGKRRQPISDTTGAQS